MASSWNHHDLAAVPFCSLRKNSSKQRIRHPVCVPKTLARLSPGTAHRIDFPGDPTKVVGREALILMALYSGYGEGMTLHGADALVVNISQTPGVVILEFDFRGKTVRSGNLYENRFISGVMTEDRKIVGWLATIIGAQTSNDQLEKI